MIDMRNIYRILVEKPEGKKGNLRDLGVDGRLTLTCILKIGCEDVDLIHVVQDKDKWRALVNMIMNFQFL
jgi:hypothetical protein